MNPTPEEKEINLEAKLLYQSIQLAALEEMVSKIGDIVFRAPSGKKMADILYDSRAKNIQNIPRYLADEDPARASKIRAILDKMLSGSL